MISMTKIAELAGVSQSTVSRALSDSPAISEETKTRVREIAGRYGYQEPGSGKRGRLSRKNSCFGVLTSNHPFFDDLFIHYIVNLLTKKAVQRGYYAVPFPVSTLEPGGMERLQRLVDSDMMGGFIIMHRHFDDELHRYLEEREIPHVYLLHCSRDSYEAVNIVDSDNYAGGYLGTSHLIAHGHRRIVTMTCPWREFADRTGGYRRAHTETGLPVNDEYILSESCSYDAAYKSIIAHADLFKEATALYVQSDIMTLGAMHALRVLGLDVPGDISVVGSDGYELGEMCVPAFDSVAHPAAELADLALSRLAELEAGERHQTPRQIILHPYMVERQSVRRV